ncbi:MAG: carbon-nitrogen hydrolase family protein, partial [Coriobacteriales bacterium]|nr:carbon-nitrogen hydrolase family protein [Coriobacteriales bacterium]
MSDTLKDIITVAVVTYESSWGDKPKNINRMSGYVQAAAARGANLVLFPETALIGYDLDTENVGDSRMHVRLAETFPGPSAEVFAKLASEYNIYIVYGYAEKCDDLKVGTNTGSKIDSAVDFATSPKIYNAAAVVGPKGLIGSYKKMHLPFSESTWCERGDTPFMFDTEWGKIGISICYDTFVFTELMRYYRASGCRLHLNPCAVNTFVTAQNIKDAVEFQSANNSIYIASANNTGCYKSDDFVGGSHIIGPSKNVPAIHYYAGSA